VLVVVDDVDVDVDVLVVVVVLVDVLDDSAGRIILNWALEISCPPVPFQIAPEGRNRNDQSGDAFTIDSFSLTVQLSEKVEETLTPAAKYIKSHCQHSVVPPYIFKYYILRGKKSNNPSQNLPPRYQFLLVTYQHCT